MSAFDAVDRLDVFDFRLLCMLKGIRTETFRVNLSSKNILRYFEQNENANKEGRKPAERRYSKIIKSKNSNKQTNKEH